MSLDAEYILDYECHAYCSPTPMEIDIDFLERTYGGKAIIVDEFIVYYSKPKYTLLPDDINQLKADKVFEKLDCELLREIKCASC